MKLKRRYTLFLLLPLLFGCKTWSFYVPQNKQTRKSQQIDFRLGRSFAGKDALCVEVNLINWNTTRQRIPRSAIVVRANNAPLRMVPPVDVIETETFRRGIFRYYQQPGQQVSLVQWAKRLYAPATLVLQPRNTQHTNLLCYYVKEAKGPFTVGLEGVTVNGKAVKMKPFQLNKLKNPNE